jgi:hypothetical protein
MSFLLRMWIRQNDADPFGSGSATLVCNLFVKAFYIFKYVVNVIQKQYVS